jgi:hypothetical protein
MPAMTTTSPAVRRSTQAAFQSLPSDHLFFSATAVAAAIVIVAGFANTYGTKLASGNQALPAIIHLHAAVFSLWLAVFVAQTVLVLRGRIAMHRTLGPWAVALAGVMLVVGAATAVTVTRAGSRGIPGVEFADPGGFLLLNLADVVIFTTLVMAGWYWRRNPQTHKRLMLMAVTGALIGPGVSRLPFASGRINVIGPIVLAFIFAGPAYDLVTRRRVHRAYFWSVPLAIAGLPPVITVLASTPVWRTIAAWILHA